MNWDRGRATVVLVSFVGADSFVKQDSVLTLKSFTLKLSPLISQPPPLPPYLPSSLFTASILFVSNLVDYSFSILILALTSFSSKPTIRIRSC